MDKAICGVGKCIKITRRSSIITIVDLPQCYSCTCHSIKLCVTLSGIRYSWHSNIFISCVDCLHTRALSSPECLTWKEFYRGNICRVQSIDRVSRINKTSIPILISLFECMEPSFVVPNTRHRTFSETFAFSIQ